jgi:hypothetical protein
MHARRTAQDTYFSSSTRDTDTCSRVLIVRVSHPSYLEIVLSETNYLLSYRCRIFILISWLFTYPMRQGSSSALQITQSHDLITAGHYNSSRMSVRNNLRVPETHECVHQGKRNGIGNRGISHHRRDTPELLV